MYRCQQCGTVTPPNTSAERIVVATRPLAYPFRSEANEVVVWRNGSRKIEKRDDSGGTGHAIVREITVCPPCKQSLQPDLTVSTP
jgi:hypothetical protein